MSLDNIEEIFTKIKDISNGNRFYKTDLHIHSPYNGNDWKDSNKDFSNFIEKLVQNQYEIIAIGDHGTIESFSKNNFLEIFNKTKLFIFPSVELETWEGFHLVLIFDPNEPPKEISDFINKITVKGNMTKIAKEYPLIDGKLVQKINEFTKAILIYPHALNSKGVLKILSGQNRITFLKTPHISIINCGKPESKFSISPCPLKITEIDNPEFLRDIRRDFAFIKVSDSHNLEFIDTIQKCQQCDNYLMCERGATWIKLSNPPTLQSLKQIIYDPGSRILFKPPEITHSRILGLYTKGIFFQNLIIQFNNSMNIIIGGRGVGKSLIIDLIKFVFYQIPEDNLGKSEEQEYYKRLYDLLGNRNFVQLFLQLEDQTIISIKRTLKIEKASNKFIFKPEENLVEIYEYLESQDKFLPSNRNLASLQNIEVYRQTEVINLAKDQYSQINLIDKFISDRSIFVKLDESKANLNSLITQITSEYDHLIELNEQIKKEAKLQQEIEDINKILSSQQEQLFQKREKIFEIVLKIDTYFNIFKEINQMEFDSSKFEQMQLFVENEIQVYNDLKIFNNILQKAKDDIINLKNKFENEKSLIIQPLCDNLNTIKINLQKEEENIKNKLKIDEKEKYFQLQNKNTALKNELNQIKTKVKPDFENSKEKIFNLQQRIRKNLEELNLIRFSIYDKYSRKAKELIRLLMSDGRKFISIKVKYEYDSKVYEEKLKNIRLLGGSKSRFEIGDIQENLIPVVFYNCLVNKEFDRIKQFLSSKFLKFLESLIVPITEGINQIPKEIYDLLDVPMIFYPKIYLNKFTNQRGKELSELSLGEKCSTILSIILLHKNNILVIDTPESELDHESILNISKKLLDLKQQRQFFIATHNANFPVVGDAELIIHLKQDVANSQEIGLIRSVGGFEERIEDLILLEGGREAFQKRANKYDIF